MKVVVVVLCKLLHLLLLLKVVCHHRLPLALAHRRFTTGRTSLGPLQAADHLGLFVLADAIPDCLIPEKLLKGRKGGSGEGCDRRWR